ncbi:MAG: hypothetical protein R3F20_15980 [Planctomycetota bacterium]
MVTPRTLSPAPGESAFISTVVNLDVDGVNYLATRIGELVIDDPILGQSTPFAPFRASYLKDALHPRAATNDVIAVAGNRVARIARSTGTESVLPFAGRGRGAPIGVPPLPWIVDGDRLVGVSSEVVMHIDRATGDRASIAITGQTPADALGFPTPVDQLLDAPRGRLIELARETVPGLGTRLALWAIDVDSGAATPLATIATQSQSGQLVHDASRDRYLVLSEDPVIREFDPVTSAVSILLTLPTSAQATGGGPVLAVIDEATDRMIYLRDEPLSLPTSRVEVDLESLAVEVEPISFPSLVGSGLVALTGRRHVHLGTGRIAASARSSNFDDRLLILDLEVGDAVPVPGGLETLGTQFRVSGVPGQRDAVFLTSTVGVQSVDLISGQPTLISR